MSTAPIPNHVPRWTIKDRLRKSRESAGLTQQQLSDLTGISRRTVSTYESVDDYQYKRPNLIAWAMATGVPLEWILTGETPGDNGDTPGGLGKPSTKWYTRYADSTVVALPTPTAQAA